jgi:hypothetical protein
MFVCLFFYWRNFAKKRNLENKKFEKELILELFSRLKVRKQKGKNRQIHTLGFHCVAKNIDG